MVKFSFSFSFFVWRYSSTIPLLSKCAEEKRNVVRLKTWAAHQKCSKNYTDLKYLAFLEDALSSRCRNYTKFLCLWGGVFCRNLLAPPSLGISRFLTKKKTNAREREWHALNWLSQKKLACVAQPILRELKHHRRRGQREQQRQNSNRFGLVKQQLCSWINLFCTFLCRHCRNTMWNRLISRSVEGVNLRECLSFSFPELPYSPSELIYRKIRQHLSNWTRNAIEFEAARIHFLSDAFVAVAVIVA